MAGLLVSGLRQRPSEARGLCCGLVAPGLGSGQGALNSSGPALATGSTWGHPAAPRLKPPRRWRCPGQPVFLAAWREGASQKSRKALQKQPRVCPEVVWVLFGCVEGFLSGKEAGVGMALLKALRWRRCLSTWAHFGHYRSSKGRGTHSAKVVWF